MIGDQINGIDTFFAKVCYCHTQQLSGNAAAAVAFLRIHGADIGGQIRPVVEVIFDYAQPADDFAAVQAEKPAQFGFLRQVSIHAFQIGICGHTPFAVESVSGCGYQTGVVP